MSVTQGDDTKRDMYVAPMKLEHKDQRNED